jgi:hypothetical protein
MSSSFSKGVQKILRYEFWPYWVFYSPFLFQWLWYSFRSGSLTYFTASNPAMKNGGFVGYSKSKATEGIPQKWLPKTQVVSAFDQVWTDWSYPLIAKPDQGERGKAVEKIHSPEELKQYLLSSKQKLVIIQEFIDYPLEFGVFYCKVPGEKARIISLTSKKFLSVVGDGSSPLKVLVQQEIRADGKRLDPKMDMEKIIPKGEQVLLEPIGNHSRGTTFLNSTPLITEKMVNLFEQIASNLENFHYGRFDVKCGSMEDLETGRQLKILEVNGANSEVTHIYQPRYGLWRAYRDILAQMDLLWKVSFKNHQSGAKYVPFWDFLKDIKSNQFEQS